MFDAFGNNVGYLAESAWNDSVGRRRCRDRRRRKRGLCQTEGFALDIPPEQGTRGHARHDMEETERELVYRKGGGKHPGTQAGYAMVL